MQPGTSTTLDRIKVKRIEQFLGKIKQETYPEPLSELHLSITQQMLNYCQDKYPLAQHSTVLDVGCGQGVALELFTERGFCPIGITLNDEDLSVCQQKGYEVLAMDQSFLDFEDHYFDFVWCRHCLEHSIVPYFTLHEFFRVLKPGGYLYIEVPSPDSACAHQTNPNHYSVLGKSMWTELIKRSGFLIRDVVDIAFTTLAGPDQYWAFIQQKPEA